MFTEVETNESDSDVDMAIRLSHLTPSPVKAFSRHPTVISAIWEDLESTPDRELAGSGVDRNESRAVISRALSRTGDRGLTGSRVDRSESRAVISRALSRTGDRELAGSRVDRSESRAVIPKALSRNLSRASFKPPTKKVGRFSSRTIFVPEPVKTPFDPEEDYDFDFESDDEEMSPRKYESVADIHKRNYRHICRDLKVNPVSNVIKEFGKTSVSLANLNLSTKELKAVLLTLINDDEICHLDVSGNRLTTKEISYFTEVLQVNKRISSLDLSSCNLSGKPLSKLADFLSKSNTLQRLNLSSNGLSDKDAPAVIKIIEKNESIRELNLSHNELGESGVALGLALQENEMLKSVDLSWNHLRGYGAVGLANGVRRNYNLENLNVAWNGFGFEGCVALGQLLCQNTTLLQLDLTCNRIHPPALFELIKGLECNKKLKILRLSQNPITAPMTSILLDRLLRAEHSTLQELDLAGVVVDKEFKLLLDKIQEKRIFIVRYDTSLPVNKGTVSSIDPKNIFNIDPIRILYFMKEHMRTIDLFLKFDRDSSNSLTKDEMQFAFELEGYPISSEALDSVMSYLDTNKDGSVDLLEFIQGERRLKRKLIQEREDTPQSAEGKLRKDKLYSQAFQQVSPSPTLPIIKRK